MANYDLLLKPIFSTEFVSQVHEMNLIFAIREVAFSRNVFRAKASVPPWPAIKREARISKSILKNSYDHY
jgi:hypothetical protein